MKKLITLASILFAATLNAQTIATFNAVNTSWQNFGLAAAQTGDGVVTITGNDNNNFTAELIFTPATSFTAGNTLFSVTAKLNVGNTGNNFVVVMVDDATSAVRGSAVFSTSSFNTLTFTTVTAVIAGRSASSFDTIRIGGVTVSGTSPLNISIDSIAAVPAVVPEPSTYASLAGLMVLGFVAVRRRKVSV